MDSRLSPSTKKWMKFQIPPPGRGCRRPVQNDKWGVSVKGPGCSPGLRPSSGASPVWGRGPTAARAADTRAGPTPPPKGLPPGCIRPPQRPSSHFSLSPHPLSPGRTQAGCGAARRLTGRGCPPPGSPGAPPGSAAPNSCGDRRRAPLHGPFRPPCSRTIPANRPSALCGAPVAAASLCLSPGDPDWRAPASPLLRQQQGRGDVCRVPGRTRSRAAKNFLSSVGLRGQRRTCTPSPPPGQPPRPLTEMIAGSPPRCAGQSRGRSRRISRCPAAGCLRGNFAPNQKRGARGRQDRPSLPHRPRGRAHSSCPPPRREADNFPSPQGDTRSAPPSTNLSFPPLIPRKTGGRPPLWPRPPTPCR